VRELLIDQPIFIGFKMDRQLRQKLGSLDDPDKKYVSAQSSTFLRVCGVGDDLYIGKVVDERLTTDQVEDIRRNVLTLSRKVGLDSPLPTNLVIMACSSSATEIIGQASALTR
jgi:hypothetical protein